MSKHANDRLQGTLDLLILKILARAGLLHGYAIAQRIHQATEESLRIEEGSLYPALQRMAAEKWLRAQWGNDRHRSESSLLHHHRRRPPSTRRRRTAMGSADRGGAEGVAFRVGARMFTITRLWNASVESGWTMSCERNWPRTLRCSKRRKARAASMPTTRSATRDRGSAILCCTVSDRSTQLLRPASRRHGATRRVRHSPACRGTTPQRRPDRHALVLALGQPSQSSAW